MSDLISFVNTSTASGTNTGDANKSLAGDFDTFLTLLTAQLQNQDPLEPTDATEFTNQLVQFSGVEQQIATNDSLDQLIASNNSTTGAAMSNYLGQTVEINSEAAGYRGEDLSWRYSLENDAKEASINIRDKNGKVVYSETADLTAGTHDFVWNGKLADGTTADEDAVYYASVKATDAEEAKITTSTRVLTQVSGVDLSYDSPAITTNAGVYSYNDILRVTQN